MNFYCLSNVNMESLKYAIKDISWVEGQGYGNYMVDLANKESSLYKNNIDVVFLHLDLSEFIGQDIDDLLSLVKDYISQKNVVFVLSTLSAPPDDMSTYLYDALSLEIEINKKLLDFSRGNDVLLMDFKRLVQKYGHDKIYDDKFWYMGRIRYSNEGYEIIARELMNLLNAYQGKIKKVLVLDLDNTLWGGIVGEDEMNIRLSNEKEGKVYLDFQNNIKRLKDLGVLLAINSKNNLEDALAGINHPMSQLEQDDFIIMKVNWQDKVTNLKEIAEDLNLGLESFVFIDDNAVERELIRHNLPEVTVPEFPKDVFDINRWFVEEVVYKFFTKIKLTREDTEKHKQYKANLNRKVLQNKLDYNAFLDSLKINLNILIDDERFVERYAQLTQKTNQFNLTTKRYTKKDINNFIADSNKRVFAVQYEDKFYKEGIIGLAIVEIEKDAAHINTFLLSCRVLKREVEFKFLSFVIDEIKSIGINEVYGYYFPTKRNVLAKTFYPDSGFEIIDETKFKRRILNAGKGA